MRLLVILSLLCPFLTNCQPLSIKGRVINEDMEPISMATVLLKRTGKMTHTDVNGQFYLDELRIKDTLIVTAVGYQAKTEVIQLFNTDFITIVLTGHINVLEDVIVNTGYQSLNRQTSTGSFEKLDNQLLNRRVSTDIISRMEGISSVYFDRRQNGASITVRGRSTIFSNANPLIILDNFPYEGDLDDINPSDIETITVLKDAAAAAIWGVRAGNGVIVLTTKKGGFNKKPSLEINANTTIGDKPDMWYAPQISSNDFIDVEEFLFSKGFYTNVINSSTRPPLSPVVEMLAARRAGRISAADSALFLNQAKQLDVRNDLDKYLYRRSVNSQYALNFSGASDRIRYSISGGYDRILQQMVSNSYERASFRSQTSYLPTSRLRFDLGIGYTYSVTRPNITGINYLYAAGKQYYPYAQFADAEGNPLPVVKDYRMSYIDTAGKGLLFDWKFRPLEELQLANNTIKQHHFLFNGALNYKLQSWLSLDGMYQLELQPAETRNIYSQETYMVRNLVNKYSQIVNGQVKYGIPVGDILDLTHNELNGYAGRLQLNANKSFANMHELVFIGGGEVRQVRTNSDYRRTYGYDDKTLTFMNVNYVDNLAIYGNLSGASRIPDLSSFDETVLRNVSLYSNASYSYDRRYFLSVSARKDASNIFGVNANQKGVPLWSAGLGWQLDKEHFYNISWLPLLKLRASYGYNGNVDYGRSAYTTLYFSSDALYTRLPWATVKNPGDPELRWERYRMLNFGLDFRMGRDRVSGSIDYFIKNGTDVIGDAPLDPTTGIQAGASGSFGYRGNAANTKGNGFDIELNFLNNIGSLTVRTSLLFNAAKSVVSKYSATKTTGTSFINQGNIISPAEGKPVFAIYSYKSIGLNENGDPVGLLNGQPSTDYRSLTNVSFDEIVYHGSAIPLYFGSFRNSFQWKNISLSANIIYKFSYYFKRSTINYGSLFVNWNGHSDYALRWQKPGDEAITIVPRMVYPVNTTRETFYTNSSLLIERGDHIRLQDIQGSYTLPSSLMKTIVLKGGEFYVYINNVGLLWKKNKAGLDPDYYSNFYPRPRTYAAGIKISL